MNKEELMDKLTSDLSPELEANLVEHIQFDKEFVDVALYDTKKSLVLAGVLALMTLGNDMDTLISIIHSSILGGAFHYRELLIQQGVDVETAEKAILAKAQLNDIGLATVEGKNDLKL